MATQSSTLPQSSTQQPPSSTGQQSYSLTSPLLYQNWDTEETIIWANSEQLPYTFLDILIEKKIDGSSIHIGIQEMQSTSERRLAQNAYNILKQKGPEILVQRLICKAFLSFRIMKQGVDCPYFKQYPDILKDDKLNHSLTLRYQKSLMTTIQSLTPLQRQKPTFLIKAFYDNLNLVNLFPLLENDFDVELGGDNWRKFIGSYKTFATPQKVIIPSFEVLNRLFDPGMISQAGEGAFEEEKSEDAVVRAFFYEQGRQDGSVGGPQNLVATDVEAHNRYLAQKYI